MADFQAISNAITTRFGDTFAATYPIVLDNTERFGTERADKVWMRLSVLFGESVQADISPNPRWRNRGMVVVSIFGPTGKGTGNYLSLADTVANLFRGLTAGGVTYRAPSIKQVGVTGDDYQINVSSPFYSDEVI